jgi:hypothetical protein
MKTWFKNWKHGRGLEIEAELKASRPTPSNHFVKSIAARINPRPANPVRTRSRIAVAGVATAVMVAAVGASGGFSSAASSIAGAARSVAQSTHATSPGPVPGAPGPNQTVRGGGGPVSAESQYAVAPTVSSFAPMQGAPGSSVTVTGTHFTGPSAINEVDLNGEATSFFVNSSTSLTFTVPGNGTSGTIEVTNGAGSGDSADPFTVLTAPTPISTTPIEGGAGTPVEIDATSGLLGTTSVKIGTKAAAFTVVSDSEIQTSVPSGAKTGLGLVVVTNPVGSAQTGFTVDSSAPTITSFTPTSGVADGSVTLMVKGTNLDTASDVLFSDGSGGTVDSPIISIPTKTQAQVQVPTGAHTGPITVLNATGQATSKQSFTVIGAPTVTSFSPGFGAVGSMVTITGSSFIGTTEVDFNGQAAIKATIKGDTQITVKVPVGATTGQITVTNGVGSGHSAGNFVVLIFHPTIGSATPNSGGWGTAVEIDGNHFIGASSVTFNGKAASFTVVNDTTIDTRVPTGAPTGPGSGATGGIIVANALGKSQQQGFTVLSTAPTITKLGLVAGPVGDAVTITGTNLNTVTEVDFGAGAATPAFVSQPVDGKSLIVDIPVGATTGPVVAINPGGQATSKTNFVILATPVVIGFSPAYGKVGTKVTIYGTNFTGATQVQFGEQSAAAKPTVLNDTTMTAVVPKNAVTGPITVKVETLSGNSGNDSFTIVVKPNPTGETGTPSRGSTIHVTGSGFTGTTGVKVGTLNASFNVNSDGDISVTIPNNAVTGANKVITIGNAAGTGTIKVTIS